VVVRVERTRLAAYDRVCGFTLRDVLPATYLQVLVFPLQVALMAERSFPWVWQVSCPHVTTWSCTDRSMPERFSA